jgi:hypothetical protein
MSIIHEACRWPNMLHPPNHGRNDVRAGLRWVPSDGQCIQVNSSNWQRTAGLVHEHCTCAGGERYPNMLQPPNHGRNDGRAGLRWTQFKSQCIQLMLPHPYV